MLPVRSMHWTTLSGVGVVTARVRVDSARVRRPVTTSAITSAASAQGGWKSVPHSLLKPNTRWAKNMYSSDGPAWFEVLPSEYVMPFTEAIAAWNAASSPE